MPFPNNGKEEHDERCDFFSEKFDPLIALYNYSLLPPKNVPPLNNLYEYETTILRKAKGNEKLENPPASPQPPPKQNSHQKSPKNQNQQKQKETPKKGQKHQQDAKGKQPEKEIKEVQEARENKEEGKEESQQQSQGEKKEMGRLVGDKKRRRKKKPTALFTEFPIQTIAERNSLGPLSLVKSCFVEKKRVKVWIRGAVTVKGTCTGFVIAFDKHLNLVLMDVEEVVRKPRAKYSKHMETKTRHIPQLFIKGDNVVMVSPVD